MLENSSVPRDAPDFTASPGAERAGLLSGAPPGRESPPSESFVAWGDSILLHRRFW